MKARRAHPAPTPEPTPAEQARCLAIARAVWPGFDELPVDVAKLRLLRVDEVLSGRGCPTLSRKDFEAVYAAALEIP